MSRAAHAPKEYIEAAKHYKCTVCGTTKVKPRTFKVAPPKPYIFNYEIGIDVIEIKDDAGMHFDILNCVCYGPTFQKAFIVRGAANGVPS